MIGISSNYKATLAQNYNYYNKLINNPKYTVQTPNIGSTAASKETQSYLANIKQLGEKLKVSADSLLSHSSNVSAFKQMMAVSSKSDVLTAKVDMSKTNTTTLKPQSVDVRQVATTQKNTGQALAAADKTTLASSSYSFQLSAPNGKNHYFSVDVKTADTKKSVQQKMADAINAKDIGVKASVVYNDQDKTSTLVLESAATGTNSSGSGNVFTVQDVTANGVVAYTGAANVSQQAQNAEYSVNNGVLLTAKSNQVDLGNGITATLLKASDHAVTIDFKKDTDKAVTGVTDLIANYNSLLSTTKANSYDAGSVKLLTELQGIAKTYASSLATVGISVDKQSGGLTVDAAKLKKSAEDGSLEKFFTSNGASTSYGFIGKLQSTAKMLATNPAKYVNNTLSKPVNAAFDINTYYEALRNSSSNSSWLFASLQNNPYSNYGSLGMLFNGLF